MNKWLYKGKVYHKRFFPLVHSFSNNVFYIRFPLSKLYSLENLIFSVNRWNIISFFVKDHGDRDGKDLWTWALSKIQKAGINVVITEIELQTFPRVLGFLFNPVSFWYCYSQDELVATIAEVNNTFGGTESYIIPKDNFVEKKRFHVSPFFQVEGDYKFSFLNSLEQNNITINYFHENQQLMLANISGKAFPWTTWNLFRFWICHPVMTFSVVFFIHFQALILYIKGVPFFGKKGLKD